MFGDTPNFRDFCTRAGEYAYCTMLAREQMRWIFFFFLNPTLSRKCFTKNLIYNFNPEQAVSKGWKSSNKLETMKLCIWMTMTINSTAQQNIREETGKQAQNKASGLN